MENDEVSKKATGREAGAEDKLVGARVRRRRRDLGMSQHELADAIGVTHQMVQKWETGHNRLAVARLLDIARALRVTPGYLIDPIPIPRSLDVPATLSLRAMELLQCFEQLDVDAKEDVLSIVRRMTQPKAA